MSGALWYRLSPDTYVTTAGERRALTLPDGSQVHLDAETKLRVDYSAKARELALLKGQARFEVAQDIVRPFSVLAGDRRVVAIGTAFNMDLLGKELRVTLIEGRVAVLEERAVAKATKPVIELSPGEQLQVTPAMQPRVVKADLQRTTAWQGGKLVFDNEPLARVVQRVSRYTERKISVADARTGDLRMSGVFDAGDLDTFLTSVEEYLGVKSQETDGGFLLARGQ
jgi:transmembrane sensor